MTEKVKEMEMELLLGDLLLYSPKEQHAEARKDRHAEAPDPAPCIDL